MNKIKIVTPLVILVFLCTSTLGGFNIKSTEIDISIQGETKNVHLAFSPPEPIDHQGYCTLKTDVPTEYLLTEGYPVLPYLTKVFMFPAGTKIEGIETSISETHTLLLDKKILPAPKPVPYGNEMVITESTEGTIYNSAQLYPDNWYSHHIGVGKNGDSHTIFLTLRFFPYRYSPTDNTVIYLDYIDAKLNYRLPEEPIFLNDEYDLLIISPTDFSEALQPLVDHKEEYGIRTQLVTLNEIYEGTYFDIQGRDEAENIKYFIKDCIEQWGIKYVLLIGGRHGGYPEAKWWCPIRYSYLDVNDGDRRFLSDLYFADIYKYDNGEIVFENWDTNDNDVFGEWHFSGRDTVDMFPDIAIGRLPCRTTFEVDVMVEKIITYETTSYGQTWSNKYVGIAGDTFTGDQWYDGEVSVAKVIEYLTPLGYEFTTLFTSDDTLTQTSQILDVISEGCGFLNFEGHGTPTSWANHKPGSDEWDIFINVVLFSLLTNKDMYPICIVGGCSNSKFEITLLTALDFENLVAHLAHGDIGLECFSWWLTRKVNGGSIATIGCTSYGYGKPGDGDRDGIFDGIQYRGGFIDIEFFRVYAQEGINILGNTHMTTLTNYLTKFPPMTDKIDGKTVEEWILFGDPSMMINGYP